MAPSDTTIPQRRASSTASRVIRELRLVLDPINEKLGPWQAESIRLHTACERARQGGRRDPQVSAVAIALLRQVEAEATRFDSAVETLSPELADNGRVADTRRALEMVARRLRDCAPLTSVRRGTKG